MFLLARAGDTEDGAEDMVSLLLWITYFKCLESYGAWWVREGWKRRLVRCMGM